MQGRFSEAEMLTLQRVGNNRLFEDGNVRTLHGLGLLSHIYVLDPQRVFEAEKLHLWILRYHESRLGTSHIETISARQNLAFLYFRYHRFKEAEKQQHQVLNMRRIIFGIDHHATLVSLVFLGRIYYNLMQFSKSEQLLSQSLRQLKCMFPPENPHVQGTMLSLAITHRAQGQYMCWKRLMLELVEISKNSSGDEDPHTLAYVAHLEEGETFFQTEAEIIPELEGGLQ